jgi:hypothetical protein
VGRGRLSEEVARPVFELCKGRGRVRRGNLGDWGLRWDRPGFELAVGAMGAEEGSAARTRWFLGRQACSGVVARRDVDSPAWEGGGMAACVSVPREATMTVGVAQIHVRVKIPSKLGAEERKLVEQLKEISSKHKVARPLMPSICLQPCVAGLDRLACYCSPVACADPITAHAHAVRICCNVWTSREADPRAFDEMVTGTDCCDGTGGQMGVLNAAEAGGGCRCCWGIGSGIGVAVG